MNIHRTSKTGCEHVIKHFNEHCVGAMFSIQIIEIYQGTGYLNGKVDPTFRETRLNREEYWIKKLRTVFLYGLNERARNYHQDQPIGKMFPAIPRSRERVIRSRRNRNNRSNNNISINQFLERFTNTLINDLKNTYYTVRIMLNNIKKKVLKNIASNIMQNISTTRFDAKIEPYYLYILDITDTKLYGQNVKESRKTAPKYTCLVEFHNKAIEAIKLASILNQPQVSCLLPADMREQDSLPMVTYKLGSTVRNKIFNYKQTVNDISINGEATLDPYINLCNCNNSTFSDPQHGHIITGDLRIVENGKLRKLLTKGPNYREPKTLNFKIAFVKIKSAINECIEKISVKTGHPKEVFNSWKNKVLEKVKQKIDILKRKKKSFKTKQVLQDADVKAHLEELHNRFVIVPIDKAANNFAFICKFFLCK